jgi:hypothetical protein
MGFLETKCVLCFIKFSTFNPFDINRNTYVIVFFLHVFFKKKKIMFLCIQFGGFIFKIR